MPEKLMPRQSVPELSVKTVAGDAWTLSERKPETFSMVVFYRGLHCPICSMYLRELDRNAEEFKKRGVDVVAVSSDSEERAREAQQKWRIDNVPIGHSLDLDSARKWGLYISTGKGTTSTGIEEPEQFSEPGVFLIKPDGTLYFGNVSTMPFARPHFDEMLKALDFVIANDYPARGEAA